MAYTLANIRDLAKQRADMENSTFVMDAEWNNYINDSYGELYDLLVAQFEDYYLADPVTFTLANGTSTYDLPATFYKLRGIDYQLSGSDYVTVRQFNFAERNQLNLTISRIGYGVQGVAYRIMGQKIRFQPEGDTNGTYRLWFIPRMTRMSSDSDVMGDVLDFAEYVVIDAAIKAMSKEESDTAPLMVQKQAMTDRVLTMARNRNADQPERIADVSEELYGLGIFSRR